MRSIKLAAAMFTATACLAAPAAQAADMCKVIKEAIRVGLADKAFTSLQTEPYVIGSEKGVIATRQIDGFICKVSTEQGRGYFACIRDDANTGLTEAAALSAKVQKCVKAVPSIDRGDYSTSYTYLVRADPRLIVYLSGSKGKLVFLNVVAS